MINCSIKYSLENRSRNHSFNNNKKNMNYNNSSRLITGKHKLLPRKVLWGKYRHNRYRELRKEFEVIDFSRKQFIFKLIRNKSNVAYYYVNCTYIVKFKLYTVCKHYYFFRTCDVAKRIYSIHNAFIFPSNITIRNNSIRMQWVGSFYTIRVQVVPQYIP